MVLALFKFTNLAATFRIFFIKRRGLLILAFATFKQNQSRYLFGGCSFIHCFCIVSHSVSSALPMKMNIFALVSGITWPYDAEYKRLTTQKHEHLRNGCVFVR